MFFLAFCKFRPWVKLGWERAETFQITHRLHHHATRHHETLTFDHSFALLWEWGVGGGACSCLGVASACCRLQLLCFPLSAACSLIQRREICQPSHSLLKGCLCRKTNKMNLYDEDTELLFGPWLQMVRVSPLCPLTLTFLVFRHTQTNPTS